MAWRVALFGIPKVARIAWHTRITPGAGFPPPPFVIAANHHSFLDPPLVGAAYGRRVLFVTLADLFGNYRLLDWALHLFEVIRVRRGQVPLGAIRKALAHLEEGGVVAVFPEGRRVVRFGDHPVQRGAAWLAVRAKVPLVAMALTGTDQVLGLDNKWRRGRVTMVIGPTLYPEGTGRDAVDELMRQWTDWITATIL
jgi:1-acyl-sn-glycerol-3-phosphate acyltransferase